LFGIKLPVFSIFVALTVVSLLFGSVGMITTGTRNSLPGDALFPLKVKLENARLKSAEDSTDQARLYLHFAGRRLSEMQYLLDQGRYDDIALATSEFARNVQQTLGIVHTLSEKDPGQAAVLNSEILFLLGAYNDVLSRNLVSIPRNFQPTVEQSESGAPSPVAAGNGDNGQGSREDDGNDRNPAVLPTMTPMLIILATSTPISSPTNIPTSAPASAMIVAETSDGTCQGLLGAITVENLRVPQGASCILDGTRVQGNIKIESGASLTAQRVTVSGNIQGEGASFVDMLAGSTVGGSIQIKQGGSARTEYVLVNGDLQLESNHGMLSIVGNQVGGNIQVFQNGGGVTVAANTVNGNLQCKENNPVPAGGNNIVQGNKEDQCADL
jgi:hypothetical protein